MKLLKAIRLFFLNRKLQKLDREIIRDRIFLYHAAYNFPLGRDFANRLIEDFKYAVKLKRWKRNMVLRERIYHL